MWLLTVCIYKLLVRIIYQDIAHLDCCIYKQSTDTKILLKIFLFSHLLWLPTALFLFHFVVQQCTAKCLTYCIRFYDNNILNYRRNQHGRKPVFNITRRHGLLLDRAFAFDWGLFFTLWERKAFSAKDLLFSAFL